MARVYGWQLASFTDQDFKKMARLWKYGDSFSRKNNDDEPNKMIQPIYSDDVYGYISKYNMDFFNEDNSDFFVFRPKLLKNLKEQQEFEKKMKEMGLKIRAKYSN